MRVVWGCFKGRTFFGRAGKMSLQVERAPKQLHPFRHRLTLILDTARQTQREREREREREIWLVHKATPPNDHEHIRDSAISRAQHERLPRDGQQTHSDEAEPLIINQSN